MQFAVIAFVMNKLEAARNKLKEHNELERSNELKQIQIGMLHDAITDLQNDGNDKTQLNRTEKDLVVANATWENIPNKITVIRQLRERTGLGLLEAKLMVEKFLTNQQLMAPR